MQDVNPFHFAQSSMSKGKGLRVPLTELIKQMRYVWIIDFVSRKRVEVDNLPSPLA
jgi:hypothetical protein